MAEEDRFELPPSAVVFLMEDDILLQPTALEEMLEIFKKVAHYEHEFNDYKTFELINGGKDEK